MDRELIGSTLQMLRAMLRQEDEHYTIENYFLRPDLHQQYQQRQEQHPINKDISLSNNSMHNDVMHVDDTMEKSNVLEVEDDVDDELPIDPECRFRMTEWYYMLCDHCGLKRETVAVTISCLDRFLSTQSTTEDVFMKRERFQLATMTCLYFTVKIHENQGMDMNLLSRLSRGIFVNEDVEAMEMKILLSIGFFVNPPTAMAFSKYLLDALPQDWLGMEMRDTVLEVAKYQTEVAVGDGHLIQVKSSWIALASLINAIMSVKEYIPLHGLILDSLSGIVRIQTDNNPDFQNVRMRLNNHLTGDIPPTTTTSSSSPHPNQFFSQILPQPPSCIKEYTRSKPSTWYEEPTSVIAY